MFSFGSSTPVVVVEEKKEKEEDEKSTKAEEEVETDDWEDLDDIENPVDLEDEIAAITVKRPANATEEDEKDEKEETEPEALLLYNGHRVSQQQIEQRAKHERLRKVNCHFYDILAKGTHSDITFLVGAKKEPIKAHRLMLAARSSVFAAMLFSKHFYESSHANVLEIEIPDVDPEAFRVMLRAMYTDVVELKPDQAMNVLFCAKKYQVEVLRFACIAYMKKDLTAENALSLFENLPGLLEEEQFVMQFVVEHLDELLESKDFVDLSKAKVLELVKSDQSACTEAKLFAAVLRWSTAECQRKGLEDTRDNRRKVLEEILPFIRFPIMSLSELSSAVAPTGILDDNAMIQLFTYLASNGAMPLDLPFNTKERELSKFNFACKADASNQYLYPGILQYIGTKEKRQDWQNPHTQGLVEVTASSHSPSLNPNNQLFHCVEINPSTSYGTENQANSWVMVDFKNYAVVPTHYRFSNTRKSNCMPTHLILQGSNDKEKWDELDARQRAAGLMESYYGDDSDLVGFSGTPTGTPQNVTSAVWKVNKPTKTPYRYLRFFQPNMSSNGGFGHLCCAGIEFYGALVKKSVRTK